MVWHNNVNLIIMLCKFGKNQSDQYWKLEMDLDDFKISMTQEEEIVQNLTKRTFTIQHKEEGESEPKQKIVVHYQWTGWPDHDTPSDKDANIIDKLVDLIYKERTTNPDSPVVIHCSAGIGRSGTLIAIYNLDIVLRENANNLKPVRLSVLGVVRRLREQRWGMVNTSSQYSFIYKFAADRIDKYLQN